MALQIVLADNQAVFRAGLARVITRETSFDIVVQCGTMAQLQHALATFQNTLVIFPTSFGTDLEEVLDRVAEARSRALLILERGAMLEATTADRAVGVMLRSVEAAKLVECLRRVAAGRRCLSSMADLPAAHVDRVGQRVLDRLTPKELQIVALVAEGGKNRDIAQQLGTKEQVVKNYLRSIYDKTGVSDRLELALFTIHHSALAAAADEVRQALQRAEEPPS